LPSIAMPPTRSAATARRRTRAAALLAAVALGVTGALSGCSSSSSSSPQASPSSSGGPALMATTVTLGKVAGTTQKHDRTRFRAYRGHLVKQVGRTVDTWLDNAFVGVSYPRSSFKSAFEDFTRHAAQDATRQKKLMTLWSLRKRIDGVTTTRRKVTLDVLAPRGVVAGVTARVALAFRTLGHASKKVTVHGRLFLTKAPGGHWRIFGFDVSQGVR
jgi:hypothetical protein